MQYALYRAEGFVLTTGWSGTGKTTLVNELLATLSPAKYVVGHLVSSRLEGGDLLRMAAYAFGLDAHEQQRAHVLIRLMGFRMRPAIPGFLAYRVGVGIFRSSGVSRCGNRASMPSGLVTVGRVSNR